MTEWVSLCLKGLGNWLTRNLEFALVFAILFCSLAHDLMLRFATAYIESREADVELKRVNVRTQKAKALCIERRAAAMRRPKPLRRKDVGGGSKC